MRHHYLNHEIHRASQCYIGVHDEQPIAFQAILHFPTRKYRNVKRSHRLVVIPDYQGIGIGSRFQESIADHITRQGYRFIAVTSNPALVAHRIKSEKWVLTHKGRITPRPSILSFKRITSRNRLTTSWKYKGE